ncbi:hypothetical protein SDC9_124333 [bioreactor metagenome]|uniref:Uncharacterized protein n=1 Tax=bioreactor metagenome TaxID=1076179 RepID=A0A645CK42_9ZZZZ
MLIGKNICKKAVKFDMNIAARHYYFGKTFSRFPSRGIAAEMHDTAQPVPAFACDLQLSLAVDIERNIHIDKLADIFGPFLNEHFNGFLLAKPRTSLKSILNVKARVVFLGHYRGYAALSKPRI